MGQLTPYSFSGAREVECPIYKGRGGTYLVFLLVMRVKVQVSVSVCGLSIDIDSN